MRSKTHMIYILLIFIDRQVVIFPVGYISVHYETVMSLM